MTHQPERQQVHLTAEASCSGCGEAYPRWGFPHRCPSCGGRYVLTSERVESGKGIPDFLSLGEGGTPLLPLEDDVYVKCEDRNPSGSYKDRGTVRLLAAMLEQGVREVVEDSSGNAGASLAAYAARAGIQARIYTPSTAAGPKRAQIARYGAELIEVPGPRRKAAEAVLDAVEKGAVYASHAWQPHWLMGVAGMALEVAAVLQPASLFIPVGQGGLLVGLHAGLKAAVRSGILERMPALMGVQAAVCSPVFHEYAGQEAPSMWGSSLAEGISVSLPTRWEDVLVAVRSTGGAMLAVKETAIKQAHADLQVKGLDVEPTSAVAYAALKQQCDVEKPAILILTGAGWKQP